MATDDVMRRRLDLCGWVKTGKREIMLITINLDGMDSTHQSIGSIEPPQSLLHG